MSVLLPTTPDSASVRCSSNISAPRYLTT
jgi:hypothetical protein